MQHQHSQPLHIQPIGYVLMAVLLLIGYLQKDGDRELPKPRPVIERSSGDVVKLATLGVQVPIQADWTYLHVLNRAKYKHVFFHPKTASVIWLDHETIDSSQVDPPVPCGAHQLLWSAVPTKLGGWSQRTAILKMLQDESIGLTVFSPRNDAPKSQVVFDFLSAISQL